MNELDRFLAEHQEITRRFFFGLGAAGTVVVGSWPCGVHAGELTPELANAIDELESYLTKQSEFRDVSRGRPIPHTLPEEKKAEVGLTRDSWKLEITSDPDHKSEIRNPMTKQVGNALDFDSLIKLGEIHAVRFPKVMTCLNIGCPLGMGIWEGIPLRVLFWKTRPQRNVRRIYYHGYHNDDPKQIFRSSLPLDRVLEDPTGLPPVIVCYKLNDQWLTSERGGPVRMVVPEAYGFKSVKWLQRIVLTNLYHANDTYAEGNNDIESRLKTWAATLSMPKKVKAGQKVAVTGYAQVGVSGLRKVQVWVHNEDKPLPPGDKHFTTAPWKDAQILAPPKNWGGGLVSNTIPNGTFGFEDGRPKRWPLHLTKVHWATLLDELPVGRYAFRSRTVDENGQAQPMPRPFRKSGHAAIEKVRFDVEA